jgi:RNA polymerase sigma-70 factor, ECF subfamily
MSAPPSREEPDDEILIAACRLPRPAANRAFVLLVRRYEPRVFRTCLRMLGNEADAEDATQDVFVKVFRNLHVFEGRSSFGTWLFAIARNQCLSAISKRAALNSLRVHAGDIEQARATGAAPDLELEHSDLLDKTLARLKPEEREVLVYRFVSGLQIDEIASLLELSLSAAKMRLYRAMERFTSVSDAITGGHALAPPPARK